MHIVIHNTIIFLSFAQGMETVFASIVGYTVVAVEQEYVLGYFPSIELANAGYEQYSRLTSSCFRKAYTCKEKDFGKRGKN